MKATTPRQRQVLRYVAGYITRAGYAPQVREICERFKFKSTHAASDFLAILERKGCIARLPQARCGGCGRRHGGYRVTDAGRRELGEVKAELIPETALMSGSEVADAS